MKHCTQCGHVLGLGRFCTNCGHPVAARHADPLSDPLPVAEPASQPGSSQGWRDDTAERSTRPAPPTEALTPAPPVSARLPPAVGDVPPPPRFPLFADEVGTGEATGAAVAQPTVRPPVEPRIEPPIGPAAEPSSELLPAGAPVEEDEDEDWEDWDDWDDRRSRGWWVLAGVVLLAGLVLGGWLLGRTLGGDDEPSTSPTADGSAPDADADAEDPVDHTRQATAKAPRTAPSTQDVDGNPTSYDASNMLDGVPETAWRVAGDGAGLRLVFTFPEPTRITEVGLVNGYAKTATDGSGTTFDWYAGHRRITEVTWTLGAGEPVRQDLEDSRDLQTLDIEPVEVRKVVLTIVATTPPGEGLARRNYTAVSGVSLAG